MSYYIQGKGYFEDSGRPIGSRRKVDLMRANVYGKQGDSAAFTRLVCESRVSMQALKESYRRGQNAMNPQEVREPSPAIAPSHAPNAVSIFAL